MSGKPVVHVIDDDDAVRDSLLFLLESADLEARGYASALRFLEAAPSLAGTPGCIVTDVRMPEMDGLTLQEEVRQRGLGLPVIVITGHGDVPIAVSAMKAGAVDFLEKPFEDEALLDAVERALHGSQPAAAASVPFDPALAARLETLTEREREVLDGIVAGHANKVIARDLGISPRTVEVHRARVMEKMQAQSVADLVRMAIAAGRVGASAGS